jgi:Ca2+/Na+ antiporter
MGLVISTLLAPFPGQARWYSWAALCLLAALYALNSVLNPPKCRVKLLTVQGYLALAFILVSLLLWGSQTFLPELSRLQNFHQYGVNLPFDFSIPELRNGFPIGHQNYVAGYLVLALPLLLGLGILQTGWKRWLWLAGIGLGLVDLYTTSSRGGWLGVFLLAAIGFVALLWRSKLSRRSLGLIGAAGLIILVLLAAANNRLKSLLTATFTGQGGGELAYRTITMATGWKMGLTHLFSGVGPGGVLPLFQEYRPAWAGREAELHYQLHSTPAQLWAELGLWAVGVVVGAIALLTLLSIRWIRSLQKQQTFLSTPPILIGCIFSSLLTYAIFSLTDYQLDNIAISGTIVIYLAVLAAELRSQESEGIESTSEAENTVPKRIAEPEHPLDTPLSETSPPSHSPPSPTPTLQLLSLTALGILIAIIIWLIPIQRAWMLSNQGFVALTRKDVNTFAERLKQAQELASWEPYYAYQLGWNLGNLSLQASDPKQQQTLAEDGIFSLKRAIETSPNQEFGHTNLAWLLLNRDPKAATQAFVRSARLVPAKRGVFYGLGLSLVAQGKTNLAIAAMTLETLRDPQLITSPAWKLPDLQPLYGQVMQQMEAKYTALLEKAQNSQPLTSQLHQNRGGLRWWLGKLKQAHADLDAIDAPLSQLVLNLAEGKVVQPQLNQLPTLAGKSTIAAWLDPAKRQELLSQAWVLATRTTPPPDVLNQLVETMAHSSSFDQWLKQNAPSRQYRRERSGFGVLNRHADGPSPVDFLTVIENIPMTLFFDQLISLPKYTPQLDTFLQGERDSLLKKVLE